MGCCRLQGVDWHSSRAAQLRLLTRPPAATERSSHWGGCAHSLASAGGCACARHPLRARPVAGRLVCAGRDQLAPKQLQSTLYSQQSASTPLSEGRGPEW